MTHYVNHWTPVQIDIVIDIVLLGKVTCDEVDMMSNIQVIISWRIHQWKMKVFTLKVKAFSQL